MYAKCSILLKMAVFRSAAPCGKGDDGGTYRPDDGGSTDL
jgi:hypothetical protein